MRDLEHNVSSPGRASAGRRSPHTAVIAGLLAGAFVLGSLAPSQAFKGMGQTSPHGRPPQEHAGYAAQHHHHREREAQAYRGSRLTGFRAAPNLVYGAAALGAGVAGLAAGEMVDEAASYPAENAVGYCANRFKSYDPSSGTYLGYDGHEHPCP